MNDLKLWQKKIRVTKEKWIPQMVAKIQIYPHPHPPASHPLAASYKLKDWDVYIIILAV
jgi:hypothetical protein